MPATISPLITGEALLSLSKTSAPVIVDASAGPGAGENYEARHLDGALFVDLETALADIKPDTANGGRHPLPGVAQFSQVLGDLGITPGSHVIVYDDKSGANAAARFWWMLRSAGHELVQVIDGGLKGAVAAGFPVNAKQVTPQKAAPYPFSQWQYPVADLEEVKKAASDEGYVVIDVRDSYRYLGEKEPIDLIAGHIPGAINIPFSTNLDSEGYYLPPDELREKYLQETGGKTASHIIVHCGSGVTACHTLLAMDYAGLTIPKLYVGSWSEWSRCGLPIATTERY